MTIVPLTAACMCILAVALAQDPTGTGRPPTRDATSPTGDRPTGETDAPERPTREEPDDGTSRDCPRLTEEERAELLNCPCDLTRDNDTGCPMCPESCASESPNVVFLIC